MTGSRRIFGLAALAAAAALAAPVQSAAAGYPAPVVASNAQAQATGPGDVDLSGTLRLSVADDFAGNAVQTTYVIENASGTTPLEVSGNPKRLIGARVHGRGHRQDDGTVAVTAQSLVVDKAAAANPDALGMGEGAATPAATTTTHKIAVVVAKYHDQSGYPVTLNQASQTFTDTAAAAVSVKNYFAATSRGRFAVSVDVYGQWDLGINQCPWNFSGSMTAALSVASTNHVDLSGYDHVVLWTKNPCNQGFAGIAYVPGKYVQMVHDWSDPRYHEPAASTMIVSHELDHNLGVAHAQGLACTDGAGHAVSLGTQAHCNPSVYDDWYSTMGIAGPDNHALLDAERLRTLGWLDSGESQTVTAAGTFHIVPVYSTSTGVRLLRIPRSTPVTTGSSPGYWTIELRSNLSGTGFDQLSGSPYSTAATGVSIRLSETPESGSLYAESFLVDSVPGAAYPGYSAFVDAPFQEGSSFTDTLTGISIHIDSVTSSGATVTVGDGVAPTRPADLTATLLTTTSVKLDWQASTDNFGVTKYKISRDGTKIAEVSPSTLTYTNSGSGAGGLHTYAVTAVDGAGNESPAAIAAARSAYVPVVPNRLEDSRYNAHLYNNVPRSFQVTGRSSDPAKNIPTNAVAVTANLTVVNQTSPGYFALTPSRPDGVPSTSTLNFPAGDIRANGVTVPLGEGGALWITFVGKSGARADFVFDVTGYFAGSTSGTATLKTVTPNRILDTRPACQIGTMPRLAANSPASFQVTGQSTDGAKNIPSSAVAVVGNLTVTNQSNKGYFALTPAEPEGVPSTSTLNFPNGDVRANNVIVQLGAGGVLWVTYVAPNGNTADAVFDVTGYFVPGTSGAVFVPMTPHRPVDSRYGTGTTTLNNDRPAEFSVNLASLGPSLAVPQGAVAIAGNLTATRGGSRGYFALTLEEPDGRPSTSTLNFPYMDNRANGVTMPVTDDLTIWVDFCGAGTARADVILDVVGYYTMN
jgi:hypothetical protein